MASDGGLFFRILQKNKNQTKRFMYILVTEKNLLLNQQNHFIVEIQLILADYGLCVVT